MEKGVNALEKEFMELNGYKIAYYDSKEGQEICYVLHGWGANIESVMPIVNTLKDKYRVIAYDAYGHGHSQEPKEVFGGKEYKDLLFQVVEHFGGQGGVFVGHSFGGKTLSLFASEYPNLVKKLVLIDASGVLPKRGLDYYTKVYSFKFLRKVYEILFFWKDPSERTKAFYSKFGSDDYQSSQGIMRKVFVKVVNEETTESFPKIKAPTLLIWGDKDEATPLYMAKIFEEKIPDAGLVVLDGGHYSYVDDYGKFRAVMGSFL